MPKKKTSKITDEVVDKKKADGESSEEESIGGDEATIDTAIIEDTFTEEFGEYNDVDNF